MKKILTIIALIFTIIPLNMIFVAHDNILNLVILFTPMIIGYLLYLSQSKNFSDDQKKILKWSLISAGLNILFGIWATYTSSIRISEFSDISLSMVLAPVFFTVTYFVHRILSIILCINIIKPNWRKLAYVPIVLIIIISLIFLPNILDEYNNIKDDIIFGNEYCSDDHYEGEFERELPWKCKLCGYKSDVSPYENVPIICFSCSLYTHRCMQCGLLTK